MDETLNLKKICIILFSHLDSVGMASALNLISMDMRLLLNFKYQYQINMWLIISLIFGVIKNLI